MYASLEHLVKRFGEDEISSLAPGSEDEVIDVQKVETALTDASEIINSYLAAKYALPLSPVPSQLQRVCCILARYDLYYTAKPEAIEKEYEKTISYLKDVARGIVVFSNTKTGQTPKQSDDVVFSGSAEKLFSQKDMKGF